MIDAFGGQKLISKAVRRLRAREKQKTWFREYKRTVVAPQSKPMTPEEKKIDDSDMLARGLMKLALELKARVEMLELSLNARKRMQHTQKQKRKRTHRKKQQ